MLNFHRSLGLFKNSLGATLMYLKWNKAQNYIVIMPKIAPKHLDVGPDGQTNDGNPTWGSPVGSLVKFCPKV